MNKRPYGFTLIEMVIVTAVMALLFFVGLPGMTTWLQNMQIRTSAEGVQAGLQLARAEALRRNSQVRFQLVDTLTAACKLSSTGTNWIVSIQDPTRPVRRVRDRPPTPTRRSRIGSRRSRSRNATAPRARRTPWSPRPGGATTVTFTGLGRVTGVPPDLADRHHESERRLPDRARRAACAACNSRCRPAGTCGCATQR
jgi:type IV fimbrial biogenesis protein FimT